MNYNDWILEGTCYWALTEQLLQQDILLKILVGGSLITIFVWENLCMLISLVSMSSTIWDWKSCLAVIAWRMSVIHLKSVIFSEEYVCVLSVCIQTDNGQFHFAWLQFYRTWHGSFQNYGLSLHGFHNTVFLFEIYENIIGESGFSLHTNKFALCQKEKRTNTWRL